MRLAPSDFGPNFRNLHRVGYALLALVLCFLGHTTGVRAQDTNNIYSDGVNPIQFDVTADAHFEDTLGGIYSGFSSPGMMLFPIGTPNPLVSSLPPSINPAPAAGPGLPVEFGTFSVPQGNGTYNPRTGLSTNMHGVMTFRVVPKGFYYLVDAGDYYQRPVSPTGSPEGEIRTRYIDISSISLLNPITPPYVPTNDPPTVYVTCTRNTAMKGNGSFLKYVFTRYSPNGDYSQPLTFNFFVQGTASSSEYNLNKSSPLTFPAGAATINLRATPIANGIYRGPVSVEIGVQGGGNAYTADSQHAIGYIYSPDRPPVFAYYLNNTVQPDATNCTASLYVGQSITIGSQCSDPDTNLYMVYIDQGAGVPPQGGSAQFDYRTAGGGLFRIVGTSISFSTPGTYTFSGRCLDTFGMYSSPVYLTITVIDRPPTVQWAGLAGVNQNAPDRTLYVGQSTSFTASYADPDNNLLLTPLSTSATNAVVSGDDGPRAAGVGSYQRTVNFTATVPGDYYFYAGASDGTLAAPNISLHINVPNRPPTIAWSVPGAYQVNANTWEVDLPGTSAPLTIAAIGNDPDNRLWATKINRGTGDPAQDQGTPFAHVGQPASASVSAGNPMTADEMLPPLQTALDSAAWEPANQDNYSWFSANAQDYDGGSGNPIHLLVRVFNQPPSLAAWTAPVGAGVINATDRQVTVNVNSPAFTVAATSSDPEHKMWAAIISRGYQNPKAGNADGQEVGVNFSADKVSASPTFTPGAETFDVPGDHWFSSTGIDLGMMSSGGNSPQGSHLNVQVVNRQPTASFDTNATASSSYVGGSIHLRGLGTDPDNAMKRAQITLVSAPTAAGIAAGTVLADSTAPANTQTYPSNLPTWAADADTVTQVSGNYVYRTTVWDRHGGTASKDTTVQTVNRPPVFVWTQSEVHVLAGQAAVLPFTLSDPDGNLGYAVAAGSNYSSQVTASNGGSFTGSFSYPTSTAGTFQITGTGYDSEGLPSVAKPAITVVVEPIDTAPVVYFTAPEPGGTALTVTRFVDDLLPVAAESSDVDNNLASLVVSLDGQSWTQAPAPSGDTGKLDAGSSFTVPVLGAESQHLYTFTAVATDKGTVAGGTIQQAPRSSAPAKLVVTVPNRAPTVTWTIPTGGLGLTQDNPFVGHLLQPLQITASGLDRDGNLASTTITQVGGSGSVVTQKSTDGRKADAVFGFTPTTPGMYVFGAVAVDTAGANSGGPISLYVKVEDYPGESTGTLGALVVSPASSPDQVFSSNGLPVIVKGGVAALGRTPNRLAINATGATKIIPVPAWLNGSQIPPLTPAILDLRTSRVIQRVDHANASLQ